MSDEPTLETCPECNHPFIVHVAYGCHYGEDAELAALRAKAALFDVLSERIEYNSWKLRDAGQQGTMIKITTTGERVYGATLAEAVRLARVSGLDDQSAPEK